jgi:aminocarboxymuconate-semialdehyde decarboxylase
MTMHRRGFLQAAAVCCGGIFLRGRNLSAIGAAAGGQAPTAGVRRQVIVGGKRVRTVDMHCHGYLHDVWPLVKDRAEVDAKAFEGLANGPMALSAKTVEARLQEMDRQGIDVHAVSLTDDQFFYWAEAELAARIVKIQNERLAELCAAHPDRFVGLGGVSMQHPDLAAEQIDDAVKRLGLRGFMIGATVNGEEISSAKFDPFWTKAQELGTVIFVHPTGFADAGRRLTGAGALGNTIALPLDTTVALSHMIFDGFLDRFTDVRILAAHGGGYLPSYIGRSDRCHEWNAGCQKMKRTPSEYLKGPQLYFDSLVYSPENLRHLVATVGASRIVVGTDFAFGVSNRAPVDAVLETPGLTVSEQTAILGGNAATLLKLESA